MITLRDRYRGCLLGGAVGDALGAPAIDSDLLAQLEGDDVITQVADDLHDVFVGGQSPASQRYPAEKEEQDHA
jgi:hypothetical protein